MPSDKIIPHRTPPQPPVTMRAFVIESAVNDGAGRKSVGVLKTGEAVPVPHAGEALVRVLRAGICNTDQELLAG